MNGKLPKGTLDKLWSDPENWRGNACYYCKDDPRIVVYKRHKWMGYTYNAAHGSAWLAILLIVGYPLGMILWLARTPEAYLLIFLLGSYLYPLRCFFKYLSATEGYEEGS